MLSDALFLLILHSLWRWLVMASLLYAIYKAWRGIINRSAFTKTDNAIRHWTATIAHIQLIIGVLLYIQSPVTRFFWRNFPESLQQRDASFFGLIHLLMMLAAITVVTIGSALTKRKTSDAEKYKTMLFWFLPALVIILLAIPWPFSPLASRPYSRSF